jgi:hypothetical protein
MPNSVTFEVSCQKCSLRTYIAGYWQARAVAGAHWESTGHPTDVVGGHEDGMRVLFTFSAAVGR